MKGEVYRACADELLKLALATSVKQLKVFSNPIKAHVVRQSKVVQKAMTEGPKARPVLDRKQIRVEHAGDLSRTLQPPPVRM
jgi:hypothetical protein